MPGAVAVRARVLGRPQVRIDVVVRRRLLDLLDKGRTRGAVRVSAGPGWGKTTLLASWVDELDPGTAVAWLTAQPAHNDPSVLAEDLAWALVDGGFRGIDEVGHASLPQLVRQLVGYDRLPGVLVLDDVHLLQDSGVIDGLSDLLAAVPSGLCIVCSGREDLPAGWGVLRARQMLVDIDEADLAFDHADTERLLTSTLGASADDPSLAGAVAAAEGWAAGLVMAAVARADMPESGQDVLTSPELGRYVSEMVGETVLAACSRDVQEFMLATCVLPILEPEICTALTRRPDALALLRELAAHHRLTVELAAQPPTFRYHHLLQQALQRRLDEERPGERAVLARQAAELLAERGRLVEATELASHSGDDGLLTSFVRRACGEAMRAGYAATVIRWLSALPTPVLDDSPDLLLVLARASGRRGDLVTAEAAIRQAQETLARGDGTRSPGLDAALRFFEAVAVPGWHGHVAGVVPVLEELEETTGALGSDDTLSMLGLSAPVLTSVLAHALVMNGELDACLRVTDRPADLADLRPVSQNAVLSLGARALALAWLDRESDASEAVQRWLPLVDRWQGSTNDALLFWCAAAWSGAQEEAEASLQRSRRLASLASIPLDRCLPELVEVQVRLRTNRYDGLDEALCRARDSLERLPEQGILKSVLADLESRAREQAGRQPQLSPQERDVLLALSSGLTRRQIAQQLHYSIDTVRAYLRSVYRKLGAVDRESALDRAHQWGVLPPG